MEPDYKLACEMHLQTIEQQARIIANALPRTLAPHIKDAIRASGHFMPESLWAAIIAAHDLVAPRTTAEKAGDLIPMTGNQCPVDPNATVEIQWSNYREGYTPKSRAGNVNWANPLLVSYRVVADSPTAADAGGLLAQAIDACDACMDVSQVEPEDAAAWQVVRAALAVRPIGGAEDPQEGMEGLHPYEFIVSGVSLRWYLKREVDALLAARPTAVMAGDLSVLGQRPFGWMVHNVNGTQFIRGDGNPWPDNAAAFPVYRDAAPDDRAAAMGAGSLIVPHEMGYSKAGNHIATAYANGWNDCRATTLGEIPDDPTSDPADRPTASGAGDLLTTHAASMQGARKAMAQLYQSAEDFMAIYDEGDAPDSEQEKALRDKMSDAFQWLVDDVQACLAREKRLNPRPTANGAAAQKGGAA